MNSCSQLFRAVAALCIIIVCCCFIACRPEQRVLLVQEESFFSDYEIQGGSVVLTCYLTFYNPYSSEVKVNVYGDFSKEVKTGLLNDSELIGYYDGEEIIVLSPGETSIYVTFIGDYNGVPQKFNRNLPDIDVKLI